MGNTDDRRDALRLRLVEAAEARIRAHGVAGLRARDVTTEAGCALGALYTVVDSLDVLVLLVNARTLHRLAADADAGPSGPPSERLAGLARTYLAFALAERGLWSALFDFHRAEGTPLPSALRAGIDGLIARIMTPLAALRPDLAGEALERRARTLFAAVHGVVALSLSRQFVGTTELEISGEVEALVGALARGL